MSKLHIIPALQDNYIWLLSNADNQAIIIDPGEAEPVIDYIDKQHINPVAILLTHHHADHVAGVPALKKKYPHIDVYGPDEIKLTIINISQQESLNIAGFQWQIIPVPGHTLGHLAYYSAPYLFCGDTLFSAGCGRIFEGTAQQMFASLNRLQQLPDDTIVCAAHEYTLSNLKFAATLVPDDQEISNSLTIARNKKITLPSSIEKEKKINLFLRCHEAKLQNKFNDNNPLSLFTFFRSQKDIF